MTTAADPAQPDRPANADGTANATGAIRRTFAALGERNYRLFFIGQLVSVSGTWMQLAAQDWLVLQLTHSPFAVGLTTALQFLPLLLFGVLAGRVADRYDKRRILIVTQALEGLLAAALAALALTGHITVWWIWGLTFAFGCVVALDNPTRQAFTSEMVGEGRTANAVALSSAVLTGARIIGPSVAGVVIAVWGAGWAFAINAVSFLAVIAALAAMRPDDLHRHTPAHAHGPVRAIDGLRTVWRTPELRATIGLLAVVAVFGLNFRVILPVLTTQTFHLGAGTFGLLSSALAVGSLFGALRAASQATPSPRLLVISGATFGVATVVLAFMPTWWAAAAILPVCGSTALVFMTTANSMTQLYAPPHLRGRVMALYSIVWLGSNPIGAPVVGWISQHGGPQTALLIGGGVSLVAAVVAGLAWRRHDDFADAVTAESVAERRLAA